MSDNLLTSPADFDEYCISTPASGRLYDVVSGLSPGQPLCGYYDIRPDMFGQSKRLVTIADKYGAQTRVWNGFVFSVDGRLPNGIRVTGGLDLGTQTIGNCFTVDEPNQPRDLFNNLPPGGPNCTHTHSWGNLADFRMHGDIPLPSDFTLSWIYKNTPGTPINAIGDFTNADIHCWADGNGTCDPTSTRVGFAGSPNRTLAITAPNQYFTKRFTQLDLRFLRTFESGRRASGHQHRPLQRDELQLGPVDREHDRHRVRPGRSRCSTRGCCRCTRTCGSRGLRSRQGFRRRDPLGHSHAAERRTTMTASTSWKRMTALALTLALVMAHAPAAFAGSLLDSALKAASEVTARQAPPADREGGGLPARQRGRGRCGPRGCRHRRETATAAGRARYGGLIAAGVGIGLAMMVIDRKVEDSTPSTRRERRDGCNLFCS